MRATVDQILNNEAERLYAKSKKDGLLKADLEYLNALINTYKTFVGETVSVPPLEHQSTAQLLSTLASASPAE